MSPSATRAERRRDARRQREQRRGRSRGPGPGGFSGAQIAAVTTIAILAVVALIFATNGGFALPGGTTPSASAVPTSSGPQASIGDHVRGATTALVTIEEWADFQCPACGLFARTTEASLITTYVDRGQVSITFRHFAFLGQESNWAAEATECAAESGKFWEYHDKLFASQAGENRGAFSKENLKRFGTQVGLGQGFAACVDSGRYAKAVEDERAAGESRGVSRTPTLFVNGRKIEGAVTLDQLRAIIDPLLTGQ